MADDCKTGNYTAVFRGVSIVILAAVIVWMCSTVRTTETAVAIHTEQIGNIYKVQTEIKEANKEMLKLLGEIRLDQLRRAGIVQGR